MKTRRCRWLPVALVVLALASAGVEGAIITFGMEGEITSRYDPLGLLDWAHTGDRVVYTFTFDTTAPDQNSTPWQGWYTGLAACLRVGLTDVAVGAPSLAVQQPNSFIVASSLSPGGFPGAVSFTLDDQDFEAIPTADPPTAPYDLSLFELRDFQLGVYGPPIPPSSYSTFVYFFGPVDSFYLVPEPCTLFTVAFGILVATRRRPRGAIR